MDTIDRQILALLRENARRTVADIAERVNLSAAPVKRRIERLEQQGVIVGYSVKVDESRIHPTIEALLELKFSGNGDLDVISEQLRQAPEVIEVLTIAGDPDAVLRIRVENVAHLKQAHSTAPVLNWWLRVRFRVCLVLALWLGLWFDLRFAAEGREFSSACSGPAAPPGQRRRNRPGVFCCL